MVAAITDEFALPKERLLTILNNFLSEMHAGLRGDKHASIKMIPSYVTGLPTGREKGRFWAIDMGGSNLRVVPVSMHGDGTMAIEDEEARKWEIPLTKMAAPGAELFDFLAAKMREAGMANGDEVGFTFSFPMEQVSIRSATLLYWTKGFTSPGVVGHDPVELLDEACKRAGLDVRVNALVNDTVGTLMAGAYSDPRTRIGVIMGTGTNACYSEWGWRARACELC